MRGGVHLFFLLVPSTGYHLESRKIFLKNHRIWEKLYKNITKKSLK